MDIPDYLERIGYSGGVIPSSQTLWALHRAHMMRVPFENFDITLGVPIELSLPLLFNKIVTQKRGGFCYELNALFAWLLKALGFSVEILSARVLLNESSGHSFDHMLLMVDNGSQYIVDVGFGDSFIEPIPLEFKLVKQEGHTYRIRESHFEFTLYQGAKETDLIPQYCFSLNPRKIDDFSLMCHYHQTSPHSTFKRKSVCSRPTGKGRITISNGYLITTINNIQERKKLQDEKEYREVLMKHFDITLNDEIPLEKLMTRNFPRP